MQDLKNDEVRQAVRGAYGNVAKADGTGCGCDCGCDSGGARTAADIAASLGYSEDDVSAVPDGANLGLGCGNPHAIASLRPGETVLDLGSGAGFDCFLAARAVGETGSVIGVDMTPEMVSRARANFAQAGPDNLEFRLGEIEHLPVSDNAVDVIMSNCVINLSPEKPNVYAEAFRVLKPGGRLAISDVVASAPLPDEIKENLALHAGCVAGASSIDDLTSMLEDAGFIDIRVEPIDGSRKLIREWAPGANFEDFIVSANIQARKP